MGAGLVRFRYEVHIAGLQTNGTCKYIHIFTSQWLFGLLVEIATNVPEADNIACIYQFYNVRTKSKTLIYGFKLVRTTNKKHSTYIYC